MKALVIGGGVGGLGVAAALGQRGVEVEVVEVRPSLETKGVGINQPGNSLRVLRDLGVLDDLIDVGFCWDRHRMFDRQGNEVATSVSGLGSGGVPANCGLSRRALHDALEGAARAAGATISCDLTFSDITETEDGAEVTMTDGTTRTVDVVIGFDGIHSQMRTWLFGADCTTHYTGFGVWRVTLPRPAEVDGGRIWQGYGNKAGVLPISDEHMYLFHVTHEPDRPRFAEGELWSALRDRLDGFGDIPGQVRDSLTPDSHVVYSPLEEILVQPPWHKGRVVIAGDAVHAGAPHMTQGAAMALEDGWVLAELVTSDRTIDDALTAFAERRLDRCRFVQEASRAILLGEMETDPEVIEARNRALAANLPERAKMAESILNQAP